MITPKKLDEMSKMDITQIDKSTLIDIRTVEIDVNTPLAERMLKYFEDIKNPYCFLVGEVPVKISFNEKGKNLDDTFADHLKSQL